MQPKSIQRRQLARSVSAAAAAKRHTAQKSPESIPELPQMANPVFVQRKCAACEEEQHLQRKETTNGQAASKGLSAKIDGSKGSGAPLPAETKSFMEQRFGADFSGVRIHDSTEAAGLSQQLNAEAFTLGNDIFFNSGRFSPDTPEGGHLLAHELAHTLQQSGSVRRKPFGSRPDWASIPIDYEMIPDPVERMELMRADYERWRWKDALERMDKGELEDTDLQYASLRNRLTGLKSAEVSNLITKIKAFQEQRDKDVVDPNVKDPQKKRPVYTAKIVEWLEVRQVISTPMPDGARVQSLLPGMIDSYIVSYNDIEITVKPDTHGASGNETGATSNFVGRFSSRMDGGKIKDLKKDGVSFNPSKLEVTIHTQYAGQPDEDSAYGKGTTAEDKYNQTTSLRVHEGKHGTDYINYLLSKPLPVSLAAGIDGQLTRAQFAQLLAYIQGITADSCELTDQVGFSQDEFLKTPEGRRSGIGSCRRP